ncbi:MAG: peptidoglycan DD-metalloendopeptidase family protein [Anaerolineales bacterium]
MSKAKSRFLCSLLILTLLLAPIPVQAQQGGPIYIVQSGDTLSVIARTFGTTVDAIMTANGISNPAGLQPGQQLVIPGYEGVNGVLQTQSVDLGDTVQTLAWRYGSNADSLARLNRVVNPNRLYLGESFLLPELTEGELALQASLETVEAGRGLLKSALGVGLNPWRLALLTSGGPRLWLVPGELVPVPDEGGTLGPLPVPISAGSIEPAPAEQGSTVVIKVVLESGGQLQGTLADHDLNFMDAGDGEWIALQGINALIDPGLYDLQVELLDETGELVFGFTQPFPIRSGGYGFDPVLFVPEETIGPENTVPEDEEIAQLVASATAEKRWQGPFEFPSDYYTESFPSFFGTRRNYNNTSYNAYHTGLDFYGGVGVEIKAPAPGTVVFSGPLTVRGNSTIIDHGWGVYTLYFHQSELLVEEGDQVDTGEVIGLVGGTGRATGPHLHWEVRVGGEPVQPLDWVERGYP